MATDRDVAAYEPKQCEKCEGHGAIEGRYCNCSIGQMAVRDAMNRGDHVAVAFNHETGKKDVFVDRKHKPKIERAEPSRGAPDAAHSEQKLSAWTPRASYDAMKAILDEADWHEPINLPMFLPDWLQERLENCCWLAAQKSGDDKREWLIDALYFKLAVDAVSSFYAEKVDETAQSGHMVLLEALKRLRNEVSGMLGIAEHEIRCAVGHTNVNAVQLRLTEAEAAIKQAERT